MKIRTILSTPDDAYVIKNMVPLYLHDLSEFGGQGPNRHGILEPTDVPALSDQGQVHDIWWQKPNVLLPFMIRAEDNIAGFAFVARPPAVPESVDQVLQEFFLFRSFRRMGIGATAAAEIFDRFPGHWYFEVLEKNLPAQAFWRYVLWRYTANRFEERSVRTESGRPQVFRFQSNSTRS
jgi:aminoglycoside 6'-N-acetyltransferase I